MIHIYWRWDRAADVWAGVVESTQRPGDGSGPGVRKNHGGSVVAVVKKVTDHFALFVSIIGAAVHQTEHECLCEAKDDAVEFLERSPSFAEMMVSTPEPKRDPIADDTDWTPKIECSPQLHLSLSPGSSCPRCGRSFR